MIANPEWTDEMQREFWELHVKTFNKKHPVGSTVWYWKSPNFGPVYETTVKEPAKLLETGPFVWIDGFEPPIEMEFVRKVMEDKRDEVKPVSPFSDGVRLREEVAVCQRQIWQALCSLKKWKNLSVPEYGPKEYLRLASVQLQHAAAAALSAYESKE